MLCLECYATTVLVQVTVLLCTAPCLCHQFRVSCTYTRASTLWPAGDCEHMYLCVCVYCVAWLCRDLSGNIHLKQIDSDAFIGLGALTEL